MKLNITVLLIGAFVVGLAHAGVSIECRWITPKHDGPQMTTARLSQDWLQMATLKLDGPQMTTPRLSQERLQIAKPTLKLDGPQMTTPRLS
ncbi:hypothetical protein GEV33_002557 [Tenebrio molitor]|uniref:Uncharacterized protein n=1 Tax=Tenebrio molitor TaxID=7067 RepID=A0A8J6HT82_TENMO|nr:hypothetical protein GEV33_002557 [Tenebrio molitor]